jgi:hypothetical protein
MYGEVRTHPVADPTCGARPLRAYVAPCRRVEPYLVQSVRESKVALRARYRAEFAPLAALFKNPD